MRPPGDVAGAWPSEERRRKAERVGELGGLGALPSGVSVGGEVDIGPAAWPTLYRRSMFPSRRGADPG